MAIDWGFLTGTGTPQGNLFNTLNDMYRSAAVSQKPSQYYGNTGATGALTQSIYGSAAGQLGMTSLIDMLRNQGRTDPRAMNMQLADISRGTQTQQDAVRGELAGRGLQNSGLGMALGAAVGQAGEQRRASTLANEAQNAEQRRRQDLDLLYRLVIGPQIDYAGIGAGIGAQNRAAQQQGEAAKVGAYSNLLGGLIGLFGG
jgi:hypothetical protein